MKTAHSSAQNVLFFFFSERSSSTLSSCYEVLLLSVLKEGQSSVLVLSQDWQKQLPVSGLLSIVHGYNSQLTPRKRWIQEKGGFLVDPGKSSLESMCIMRRSLRKRRLFEVENITVITVNTEFIFASLCLGKPCSHFEGDLTVFTACAVQCQYKENRSTETGDYLLLRKKRQNSTSS